MTQQKHQIDVELDPEVSQGKYANLAIISHSTSEFVLDFAAVLPGVPKPHHPLARTRQEASALVAGECGAL